MKNGVEDQRYTFPINPSAYALQDGPRAQVLQTESGGQVQVFGHQLPQVSVSGVTGWQQYPDPAGGLTDGFAAWTSLKAIVDAFITNTHEDSAHTWELRLYNWSDNQAWSVMPLPYQVQRTAALPMYYSYSMTFVALDTVPPQQTASGGPVSAASDPVRQLIPPPTDVAALGLQLTTIANGLLLNAALCKDLIVLDNVAILSPQEQSLIAQHPIYGSVPASQTLTAANFPGIAQYTGYDIQPRPTGSALQIIDSNIYPITTGISVALTNQQPTIPTSYSNVTTASAGLQTLAGSLQTAYSAAPPAFLMRYLDALRSILGVLIGQSSWFQAS